MNKKENEKKWYQTPSNIIIAIACVILVPMLIINISLMLQSKMNADKVPSVFGYKPFMVLSGSMEGKILKGDLIITKEVDPSTLKVDDIIAFRDAQGTVTTHRIIDEIDKDGERLFITKGDNNNTQDKNLVSLSDVEGIYLFRIPGVGSLMKTLSEPITVVVLVLGITVAFGIGFVISNKNQREQERQEFLEFKKMKEEMELAMKTKKTKSIKAEEDEELLEDEEEEIKPQPKKKTSTTSKKTTSSSVKKKSTSTTPKKPKSTK